MNNRPHQNRNIIPQTIGQARREFATIAHRKQSREKVCKSKRQIYQNELKQMQQAQARPVQPAPPPSNFKVFPSTTQVQSSSVPQTPSRGQQEIAQQPTSLPSSLKKKQGDLIGVHDEQFDSVSVTQQELQGQQQNLVVEAGQVQNLIQHQSQQFEHGSKTRQDEQGLKSTPQQKSNHQINVPPQQEPEVQNLNSQSQVQNFQQNISKQQNGGAWLKNQNGEQILQESQLKNPNLVYSQQIPPQQTPSQQTPSQQTPSQHTSSQKTPSQRPPVQEDRQQETPKQTENQFQSQGRYQSESKSVQQSPQRNRSPTGFSTSQSEKKYESEWKTPPPLKFGMFTRPSNVPQQIQEPQVSSSSSEEKNDWIFGNLVQKFRNLFR